MRVFSGWLGIMLRKLLVNRVAAGSQDSPAKYILPRLAPLQHTLSLVLPSLSVSGEARWLLRARRSPSWTIIRRQIDECQNTRTMKWLKFFVTRVGSKRRFSLVGNAMNIYRALKVLNFPVLVKLSSHNDIIMLNLLQPQLETPDWNWTTACWRRMLIFWQWTANID